MSNRKIRFYGPIDVRETAFKTFELKERGQPAHAFYNSRGAYRGSRNPVVFKIPSGFIFSPRLDARVSIPCPPGVQGPTIRELRASLRRCENRLPSARTN